MVSSLFTLLSTSSVCIVMLLYFGIFDWVEIDRGFVKTYLTCILSIDVSEYNFDSNW